MPEYTLQAEIRAEKAQIRKVYGWHFLAKEIADFAHISFYDVYERSAMEIFATVKVIIAKNSLNQS